MTEQVEAILFDMGGTLRRGTNREFSDKVKICQQILGLTGFANNPVDFARLLDRRANAYRKWSKHELVELDEVGFWTQWMLPELAADKLSALAVEINQIWRNADRSYEVLPDAKETILGLFRAGYRLGLVSNTTSSVEAPNLLDELGLSGCFDAIVLSCQVGIRKPRPEIILEAIRRMEILPERCAYIGNLPDRDVAAARNAGFSRTVILRDHHKPFDLPVDSALVPDHYIDNLKELLEIFPAPSRKKCLPERPVYDAALSTMWGINKFPDLNDFFLSAQRLGFAKIELNHQVTPAMLAGIDLGHAQIGSIHEPCPAVIPANVLKKQDRLISSPDEGRRQEGIDSIKRSIDLAHAIGVHLIVVHPGQIQSDGELEIELRALIKDGQAQSARSSELRDSMVETRSRFIGPCLDAVKKSLLELLEYAGHFNIRLGVENRYHYYDLPILDEMGTLLDLAGPDRLGFLYDVGHAQTQEQLGFAKHEEWLKRHGNRIIGVHLHDVIGINDHQPPGQGNVDFHMVASYLPENAFRTLEVHHSNSPEQIKNAMKYLVDAGCVSRIS
jgi:FMN phosphatase YigB (HAD superfamily)/sugar phosphate isomerase/epimerase